MSVSRETYVSIRGCSSSSTRARAPLGCDDRLLVPCPDLAAVHREHEVSLRVSLPTRLLSGGTPGLVVGD